MTDCVKECVSVHTRCQALCSKSKSLSLLHERLVLLPHPYSLVDGNSSGTGNNMDGRGEGTKGREGGREKE